MNIISNVSELPVMEKCCKTCPFKIMDSGQELNPQLAAEVMSRNLFNSQQICHGTEKGPNRIPQNRCRGYFDKSFKIYTVMGLDPKKNLINNPKNLPI